MPVDNLVPAGLLIVYGDSPAVALRYTAGYAHHAPCGAKKMFFDKFIMSLLTILRDIS
jgi:hypothetical protein